MLQKAKASELRQNEMYLTVALILLKYEVIFLYLQIKRPCTESSSGIGNILVLGRASHGGGGLLLLWSTGSRHKGFGAPWHVGSSWTRDQTHVPCVDRQMLNH